MKLLLCIPLVLLMLPSPALAHSVGNPVTDIFHGFGHPFSGLDHILAMTAVGLWAVQLGGRSLWVLPTVFVTIMVLGSALAAAGLPIAFAELGILLSVSVLGLLIARGAAFSLLYSSLVVGGFALLYGYVHGAQIPVSMTALPFVIGFALASVSLHASGIGLGLIMQRCYRQKLIRFAGGAVALTGLYLSIA